jgi:uncharacterized membrane protein YphA (DoxX/SURF4 family)
MMADSNVELFQKMQLPPYLLPFLGIAKVLGIVGILVPGFPRVKEWAYAGLMFDMIGAIYCLIASGTPPLEATFIILPVSFLVASYLLYHKRLKLKADTGLRYAV